MYREQIRRVMIGVYALDDGRAHSQVEISRNWMMPKTTLNTIVRECVEKGLVELEHQPHIREKYLRLTPEGQAYGQKILPLVYEAEERAYRAVLQGAEGEFVEGFEAFAQALCREMTPLPGKTK